MQHRDRFVDSSANSHWRSRPLQAPQEPTLKSNNEQHADFDKAPPPSAFPSLLTGTLTSYRSFRPTEGPEQEVKAPIFMQAEATGEAWLIARQPVALPQDEVQASGTSNMV